MTRTVYRRDVRAALWTGSLALCAAALASSAVSCTTVDPGPSFVVPDENFDADFFFCRVEPDLLFGKKCGPGDPAAGDAANGCHFNSSAVSGMALAPHPPVDCGPDRARPVNRGQIGAGSAAQGNLQAASLVMSRDFQTAPILLRPTGLNHPRAIFGRNDPITDVIREWAQK
ncbi:MAG: hypothetical protein JST00_23030 [Deltaproteobacteria bacterium]|nr:hypothetical protein [Deltaproteobacteria bacterium]